MPDAKHTKERPILFSAPMVRAILDGRKTQTRRAVSRGNSDTAAVWSWLELDDKKVPAAYPGKTFADNGYLHVTCKPHPDDPQDDPGYWTCQRVYPRWGIGERLWVRETWAKSRNNTIYAAESVYSEGPKGNADDWDWDDSCGKNVWRPSIFMPRSASRLTLEITDVRVQRAHQISEADAEAEGVQVPHGIDPNKTTGWRESMKYRLSFEALWDSINSKGAWAKNPWVWAMTFKVVKNDK